MSTISDSNIMNKLRHLFLTLFQSLDIGIPTMYTGGNTLTLITIDSI